jgi:acetyl esterase/lipase
MASRSVTVCGVTARSFVRALRAVSRSPVAYAEIPGGQHAFEVFHSPRADRTLDGVFRFLAWLRGTRAAG